MKKSQYIPVSPWRWQLMATFIALLFSLLVWRVVSLQVLETDRGYEFLQNQGEARFVRTAVIPAYRGMIADRRGEPLAVSTPVISVWTNPGVLAESGRLPELAAALGQQEEHLRKRVVRYRNKSFMYLQRHMVPADARAILALKIPGVSGQREYQRYYPAGEVTAHLVGMTNVDDRGIEGVELAYEEWLQGTPGRKQVIKDRYGEVVRDIGELAAARAGKQLTLSIDLRLQYLAHRELQRAVAASGAASGSVVTLDSRTGEVLAMANHPIYNPNNRSKVKSVQTRNRAIIDAFEMGSTMKPFAVLAALESGTFTPDSSIDTSPGRIQVGSKMLFDPVNYGAMKLSRVVAKSSQVGIVKMALQLEEQALWQMYNRFGFGQTPGAGFPGESAGLLPYREAWRPIERATLAYGHGLTVTPLQLAVAYATLADGGRRHPPSVLKLPAAEVLSEQVVSADLSRQMIKILRGVTADGGTGTRARIPGYWVAGKTGTAHKAAGGGYADNRYLALFAGMAPASNPRLVTVVLIDEPQGDYYHGGDAAAPVFARVTAGALRILNIAPDQPRAEWTAI